MNTIFQPRGTMLRIGLYLLLAVLCGCRTASHCFVGSQISIPNNDTSAPSIAGIDFHMPDGTIVSRKPGDGLSTQITVPSNGDVTVWVVVEDQEGVKDSQLFIAPIECSIDPANETESCSGPPLLSGPTANNLETNGVGGAGCTQRLTTQKVSITQSSTGSTSAQVTAKGINFGGQPVSSTKYVLSR